MCLDSRLATCFNPGNQKEASTLATPFITSHAIARYQERVDPAAPPAVALRAISEILDGARSRSRPRRWTAVEVRPGCRYLYSAAHPGICLVVRDGAVLTVFSRRACRVWRARLSSVLDASTSMPKHEFSMEAA